MNQLSISKFLDRTTVHRSNNFVLQGATYCTSVSKERNQLWIRVERLDSTSRAKENVKYAITMRNKKGIDQYSVQSSHDFSRAAVLTVQAPEIFLTNLEEYFPERTVHLLFEIRGDEEPIIIPGSIMQESIMASDRSMNNLISGFGALYVEKKNTDVVLVSNDGRRFPGHKLIFTIQSRWFADTLSSITEENREIPVPFKGTVVKNILDYFYFGIIEGPFNMVELFDAAQALGVCYLQEELERRIMGSLTRDTVCEYYRFAHNCNNQIEQACISYLKTNIDVSFFASDSWEAFVSSHHDLSRKLLEATVLALKGL